MLSTCVSNSSVHLYNSYTRYQNNAAKRQKTPYGESRNVQV